MNKFDIEKSFITQLIQLNQKFYSNVHKDFHNSRKYPWEGWKRLIKRIPKYKSLKNNSILHKNQIESVLDVGCGNGRFAHFLAKSYSKLTYIGVDFSKELLARAKFYLSRTDFKYRLLHADLLHNWNKKITSKFDLIVAFGLFHHIPGYENRKKLLKKIVSMLNKNGIFVITVWQFPKFDRFRKKILSKNQIKKKTGINPKLLKKNDYILDWQRTNFRYCHYLNEEEVQILYPKSVKLIDIYEADGRTENINKYYIFTLK